MSILLNLYFIPGSSSTKSAPPNFCVTQSTYMKLTISKGKIATFIVLKSLSNLGKAHP